MDARLTPPALPGVAAPARRSSAPWVWVVPLVAGVVLLVGLFAWRVGVRFPEPGGEEAAHGPVLIEGVTFSVEGRIRDQLMLQGFLQRGRDYIAIINDQLVEDDDTLSVKLGSRTYDLRVKTIEEGRIVLALL